MHRRSTLSPSQTKRVAHAKCPAGKVSSVSGTRPGEVGGKGCMTYPLLETHSSTGTMGDDITTQAGRRSSQQSGVPIKAWL